MQHTATFEPNILPTQRVYNGLPADFNKVMAEHYQQRMNDVIREGKNHTAEYRLIRNSLTYYKNASR